MAREFGVEPATEWIYCMGIRHDDGARAGRGGKEAATAADLRHAAVPQPFLTGIEGKLRERKTAVYALIEREYKVSIQRVEQELQGVLLDADDAANLDAEPGAPALRILRRYYGDRDTARGRRQHPSRAIDSPTGWSCAEVGALDTVSVDVAGHNCQRSKSPLYCP